MTISEIYTIVMLKSRIPEPEILFSFFKSTLDDFERVYNSDLLGRENTEDRKAVREDRPLPLSSGFNIALASAVVIMLVLWGFLLF